MAAATFKQIENKIEGDLQALTEHFTFVQAHANRQVPCFCVLTRARLQTVGYCLFYECISGGFDLRCHIQYLHTPCHDLVSHRTCEGSLDMKYLSTRYERGVKKVEEFMTDHQRYVHCASLADALPDFMRSLNEKPMTDVCLSLFL